MYLRKDNSPESLVDDAENNPSSSPNLIFMSKDTTMDRVQGVNSIGPFYRDPVTQR